MAWLTSGKADAHSSPGFQHSPAKSSQPISAPEPCPGTTGESTNEPKPNACKGYTSNLK